MGSDLGHDDDSSNQLFRNNNWSKKEKEFLRLLLSNQTGSIIMVIFIELMTQDTMLSKCLGMKWLLLSYPRSKRY